MNLAVDDLDKIEGIEILNRDLLPKKFGKVTIDSRQCRKGDLFFAVKGERFDGHDFLEPVFNKGVGCAVVSKKWFSKNKKRSFNKYSIALVNDPLTALGSLANIYRRKFLIPIIAVAGSNGKTTAKDYIAHVLSQKYNVLKTEGNYNNAFGVPLTLFRLNKEHDIAVVELGTNHFGEVRQLSEIAEPQLGLITNIGKEHLEFLKDINGAAKAECELVEYLDSHFGMFFLNNDDRLLVKNTRKININVFSYGSHGNSDVEGKLLGFDGFYAVMQVTYGKTKFRARLNEIGRQSFNAALAASAVGLYFEVPPGKIKKAISGYRIESGKRNKLRNINGIWVIDDSYNSNPDSVKVALENLKSYKVKGSKYIVLGDMLELGRVSKKEHTETGKLVKKMKFNNLFTYGKESFNTFRGAKGIKNDFHFEDKKVLADTLRVNMKKGDLILLKGSRGMKMEEILELISK